LCERGSRWGFIEVGLLRERLAIGLKPFAG
jgi:hypothetical protein